MRVATEPPVHYLEGALVARYLEGALVARVVRHAPLNDINKPKKERHFKEGIHPQTTNRNGRTDSNSVVGPLKTGTSTTLPCKIMVT